MSRIRVAAAQIECRAGDIAGNLDAHLRALDDARRAGADLVVFPELSLPDYLIEPDVAALGREPNAPEIERIAAACRGMTAVVGIVERDLEAYYNSSVVLRDGRIEAMHRKINLPSYGRLREREVYRPGTTVDTWAMGPCRAATLICADTWNPALPWLAALRHADLLVLPVASALGAVHLEFDNPDDWDINIRHTAITYGLPVIMCNHCGARSGLRFWGGSRIVDAHGKVLPLAGASSELLVANISVDDIRAARTRLPTMQSADPALVAKLIADVITPKGGHAT